jgi:hypothetical protein
VIVQTSGSNLVQVAVSAVPLPFSSLWVNNLGLRVILQLSQQYSINKFSSSI